MILAPDGRVAASVRWDAPAPLGFEERAPCPFPGGRIWMRLMGKHNHMTMIASADGGHLHVSISHSARYPTWDEILAVRAWAFPPEMEVVMVLARKGEYVNMHPNCFHLWESACGREGR